MTRDEALKQYVEVMVKLRELAPLQAQAQDLYKIIMAEVLPASRKNPHKFNRHRRSQTQERIAIILRDHGGTVTVREIAILGSMTTNAVHAGLAKLKQRGMVHKHTDRDPYRWELAVKPDAQHQGNELSTRR